MESNENSGAHAVTPDNFDAYLPWAAKQHQLPLDIVINRVVQNEYVSSVQTDRKGKGKPGKKPPVDEVVDDITSVVGRDEIQNAMFEFGDEVLMIHTVYDSSNNLIELCFIDNKEIPRKVIIIIAYIIKFHPHFISIKINRGLDGYIIYELRKLIGVSNLTEICLDDTYLNSANYHILLQPPTTIKQLSLKRCKIRDDMVKKMTEYLYYPLDASKNLFILNLASNYVTDVGAEYLAKALRSNRNLAYLNLSDNNLSDKGAIDIFNSLTEFEMTSKEIVDSRSRLVYYLKQKSDMVSRLIQEMKISDTDKKISMARKKTKVTPKGKALEKEPSLKSFVSQEPRKSVIDMYYDKAVGIASSVMGEFTDPFMFKDIVTRNHVIYSLGNNKMAYLNLSYNNLSFLSIKKLLDVLNYQRTSTRWPKGLVNINVDGNFLPRSCIELVQINNILETGLNARRLTTTTKKGRSYMKPTK